MSRRSIIVFSIVEIFGDEVFMQKCDLVGIPTTFEIVELCESLSKMLGKERVRWRDNSYLDSTY